MILLITEAEIKEFTDMPKNLDSSVFCHWIQVCQDEYIKSAIGEQCFTDLLDAVENDTLTAEQLTMLNGNDREFRGLKPALAFYVNYKAYPNMHSRITPTGLQTKSGEDFTAVDSSQLNARINDVKVTADSYLKDLICFLENNPDDYPCFCDSDDCCTDRRGSDFSDNGIIL